MTGFCSGALVKLVTYSIFVRKEKDSHHNIQVAFKILHYPIENSVGYFKHSKWLHSSSSQQI